ncbi:MAG TPA: DNRLRE domain-containing protein [Gaiellaceae bacterium]|nr:DNRLRE domain-containing protein [Gaiellaceae bacterium]
MRRLRITPFRLAVAIVLALLSSVGVAYAAGLGLSSNKLHAWSQTLTKGTCDQTSSTAYDTWVQEASPLNTAGGTDTTFTIGGAAGSRDYAFIRFDLSGCSLPATAGADSATLTLTVTSKSNDTISLFPVYSSWSASTLNWAGAGGLTIGSTATTTFVPSSTGGLTVPVTADVDAAIKAGAFWGWELRDTSGTSTCAIGASENPAAGKRPSMTLGYEK